MELRIRRVSWVMATVLLLSLAGATVSSLPAGAAKKKPKRVERVEKRDYLGATGVRGTQDTPCVNEPVGCVVFSVNKGEKFVSIDIEDAAGEPIWASVYVNGYSDGTDAHEHVCGSSEGALTLAAGVQELVVITAQTTAGATNPCVGPVTTGTVTATFSNLP